MPEKEFKLDPDSELRFEVEGAKETVELTVSFKVVFLCVIFLDVSHHHDVKSHF